MARDDHAIPLPRLVGSCSVHELLGSEILPPGGMGTLNLGSVKSVEVYLGSF